MEERDPKFSRVGRKKKRSNQLLNILIAAVVILILITGYTIISGGNDDKADKDTASDDNIDLVVDEEQDEDDSEKGTEEQEEPDDISEERASSDGASEENDSERNRNEEQSTDEPGTVTITEGDDGIVKETVIETAWEPIGTEQTGEHVSLYDGESVDWNEKKKAISYATNVPESNLIFWKIKNGGGPQKSIGIVSTKDQSEKYRVYLEWVDGEGWKPVQMDILNTLDFDY